MMLTVVLTGMAIWAFGWVNSRHRASHGADLLALAAAQAFAAGEQPCQVAQEGARRQGLRLEKCVLDGDVTSFVVTCTVSVELRPTIRASGVGKIPTRVRVTAKAGTADAASP